SPASRARDFPFRDQADEMGGAATPPCRGSTLGKPQIPVLTLRVEWRLLIWKIPSYFSPPRRTTSVAFSDPALTNVRFQVPRCGTIICVIELRDHTRAGHGLARSTFVRRD